jgi:hypothetical protein
MELFMLEKAVGELLFAQRMMLSLGRRESGKFNQFKWSFFDQDKIEVRTVKVDNADEVEDSLSLE